MASLLCQSSDAGTLVGAYKSKFSSELLHIIGISSQLDDSVDACRRSDWIRGDSFLPSWPLRRGAAPRAVRMGVGQLVQSQTRIP